MKTASQSCHQSSNTKKRRWPLAGGASQRADLLGVSWLHGSLRIDTFRRGQPVHSWEASAAVNTLEEFESGLDQALAETGYRGTEVFLILANEQFSHQLENVPKFSDKAARSYLRGRVRRIEKEQEPMLWVCQRALPVRKEHAYLVHMLPGSFYYRLNELFIARHRELTRIVPLVVPLQAEISALAADQKSPVLLAAEAGAATAVMAGLPGGEVLFSRTTLASWRDEPDHVAVEVNRSLLYAKQQFGVIVERVWLLGPPDEGAREHVVNRCGSGKEVLTRSGGPEEWLRLVARMSPGHPVNLVLGYLRTKRRNRWVRTAVMAACWAGLALAGAQAWTARQEWLGREAELSRMASERTQMEAERSRLVQRNAAADRDERFVGSVERDRLPPVPSRFLASLAAIFPEEGRMTNFSVKLGEEGVWAVKIDGEIEADAETTRMITSSLKRQLVNGPFRVRFQESVRPSAVVSMGFGTATQHFVLEGVLFEN